MTSFRLRLTEPRPYFAEVPYYIWGQINYDSDGDCKHPKDTNWNWLQITHRETDEQLDIAGQNDLWMVDGPDRTAARVAHFLVTRCSACPIDRVASHVLGDWDHATGAHRAARVKAAFERPELEPFAQGHMFWGSWKWIGWFATEFTWIGRWIMESVLATDTRGINLCVCWLRDGTFAEAQSDALRYALERLTDMSFSTDQEWVRWYFNGPGEALYPEPDFEKWLQDLKAQYVDV